MGYIGLLEGLYHSQSTAAKAGGTDEQEKNDCLERCCGSSENTHRGL